MSVLAQHFVLCQQQALDSTHQRTALAGQIGCSLTLECGLEQITWTDTDTECQYFIQCLTTGILINSIRRVQATAFEEHRAQWSARTFGSHHNDVNIFRRHHARTVTPVNSETMREIQGLARSQIWLDGRPQLHLSCIGKQHANYRTLFGSFLKRKQSLSRHPAVSHSLVVCLTLTLAYNYIKTVITQVTSLTGSLNTIP